MPATIDQIRAVLTSDQFTDAEKWVVRAQYRQVTHMGNFEEKLWELMCAADTGNLFLLSQVYPDKARALMDWRTGGVGNLADRIRAAGLPV